MKSRQSTRTINERKFQRNPSGRSVKTAVIAILVLISISISISARADTCDEPNDSVATACPISFNTSTGGTIDSSSDVDAYKFTIDQPDTTVVIELTDLPQDYDLYLASASGGMLGQSVHEGIGPERIQLTLAPGTYVIYVQVDESRYTESSAPYTLRLSLATPTSTASPRSVAASPVGVSSESIDLPALGGIVYEASLRDPGSIASGSCQSGRASGANVDDGFLISVRGACSNERTNELGQFGAALTGVTVPDGEIRVEFKMLKLADRMTFHLWFRMQDQPLSFYLAYLAGNGHPYLAKLTEQGSIVILAASQIQSATWDASAWNALAVRLDGPRIWMLVNDQPVLNISDQGPTTGRTRVHMVRDRKSDDADEAAVVVRNLRVSRLANGEDARAPTVR